jgi:hypothetical protein
VGLVGLGFWTQGFGLSRQAFSSLSHTSRPFCSGNICPSWPQLPK